MIPEKWRHLINLSVLASSNAWDAARLHLRRALLTGVTPKEILQVLEISGGRITGVHNFLNTELFGAFGFPPRLDP